MGADEEVADFIATRSPREVADFLRREETTGLTDVERRELDHFEKLELLMNLAKARARQLLAHG